MTKTDFLTKGKIVFMDKFALTFNPNNPRIDLDSTSLDASIALKGVIKPVLVNQNGMLYWGHRRLTSLLKTNIPTIPTITFDDSKMDEIEKYEILLDYSDEQPLSKAEAYKVIKELFRLGYTEATIIRNHFPILNCAFGAPQKEKIAEAKAEAIRTHADEIQAEGEVYKTKHRGTVQNMKRLATMPDFVGDEYQKAWQGNKALISQGDVKILYSLWEALVKADGSVTRANPPQAFVDKYNELVELNSQPDDGIVKSVKRTKADIEQMAKTIEDAVVRKTLSWVLGDCTNSELVEFVKNENK